MKKAKILRVVVTMQDNEQERLFVSANQYEVDDVDLTLQELLYGKTK